MQVHIPEPDATPEEVASTTTLQEEHKDLFANTSLRNVTIEDCQTSLRADNEISLLSKVKVLYLLLSTGQIHLKAIKGPEHGWFWKVLVLRLKPNWVSRLTVPDAEWTLTLKECTTALFKQVTRRKLHSVGDSKPGKEEASIKRRKTFKRFKHDLEQVVLKGRCTEKLQYGTKTDDTLSIFASYLLSIFGDFVEAHSVQGHQMANNPEVMDIWACYSGEDMTKITANKHLMKIYEFVYFFPFVGPAQVCLITRTFFSAFTMGRNIFLVCTKESHIFQFIFF